MDPLSITATVITLVEATTKVIKYLEAVRHQKADARAFAEGFKQIKHDLESLQARLVYIQQQTALPAASPSSLVVHQQHADKYRRADAMGAPDGAGDKLKARLETLCEKVSPEAPSRFDNLKAGMTWSLRKERLKEEQLSIVAEIKRMRAILSDDQAELQQESTQILRKLEYFNDDNRNIEILDWICADPLDTPLHPASALALENTGFVRSDDLYTQWHQDKLWQLNCFGKPGAGKSFRAQAVLNDLHDRYDRHAIPILSLFFNYKNAVRQSLRAVLCSLLRQLITSRRPIKIPQGVLGEWQTSQYGGKRPLSESKVRYLLQQELDEIDHKFLVVDALDEAEGCMEAIHTEIRWLRKYGVCIFSTELHEQRISNDSAFCYRHQIGPGPFERLILYWQCKKCHGPLGQGIQICQDCFVHKQLTCDDPNHILRPPGRIHVEVTASSHDVQRFAQRYLEDAVSGGDVGDDDYMFAGHRPLLAIVKAEFDTHIWSEIPAKVAQAANGNFLHAQLFLERLKEQRHRDGALSLLKQLQLGSLPDIEGQYHEKLVRCLQGSGGQVALDHLNIVAAAVEVLEYDQLAHAAAVIAGDETLSDFAGRCCRMEIVRQDTAGLLSIDPKGQTDNFVVGFSHRTFSVYVDKHPDVTLPDAKQRMFNACLAYLSLNPFTKSFAGSLELDATLQDYPFASYAACYWALHAQDIEQNAGNSVRILAFLNDTERLSCAMQVAWRAPSMPVSTWDISGGITPLHACAFYGLETICALLVNVLPGVDPVEETYHQTPLIYACRQGHVEIVRLLLKAGADPNHMTKRARSPLIEAIEYGQQNVFQLLLMQDCLDINLSHTGKTGRPPLVRAAALGNEKMVAMLLKRADLLVNEVDGYNCSALSRAVQTLQIGCVRQLLLCDDTDLSLRDTEGDRTALDWLAGETLNYQQDADKINALAAMLMNDHRAPLPSDDAIITAIEQGKEELLQIYIQGSLNHLYTDSFGRNFLHLAATEGVCAIVTLFHSRLAKEAAFDIDFLDQYRATALHAVCSRLTETSFAHVDTIKFLLDAGANPSLTDDQGRTPAMRARRASQPLWDSHVSALFASNKSDVPDDVGGAGSDTLEMALRTVKVDAFKTALDQLPDPISPEIAQYSSSTILHHAMGLKKDFRREVLQLLVPRSKLFLSDTDADGQTCAHLAVKQNSLETLRLLCEAGIDINIQDRWKLTPFELAQRWQRFEFCVYLASEGAILPSGATIQPDVLRAAIEDGNLKAVERLIDAGIDTNFRDVVKGSTNVQCAQELREAAVNASRDELLAKNDKSMQTDLDTWNKHKYSAPEVVKRDAIFRLIQKLQDKTWTSGSATQAESNQALTGLLEKLQAMDPGTLLCVSEVGNILEETTTPNNLPAFAHAQQSMGPNVASAVTSSLTYNIGEGVVIVAIAIVLGIVAISIAWIMSPTRAH